MPTITYTTYENLKSYLHDMEYNDSIQVEMSHDNLEEFDGLIKFCKECAWTGYPIETEEDVFETVITIEDVSVNIKYEYYTLTFVCRTPDEIDLDGKELFGEND